MVLSKNTVKSVLSLLMIGFLFFSCSSPLKSKTATPFTIDGSLKDGGFFSPVGDKQAPPVVSTPEKEGSDVTPPSSGSASNTQNEKSLVQRHTGGIKFQGSEYDVVLDEDKTDFDDFMVKGLKLFTFKVLDNLKVQEFEHNPRHGHNDEVLFSRISDTAIGDDGNVAGMKYGGYMKLGIKVGNLNPDGDSEGIVVLNEMVGGNVRTEFGAGDTKIKFVKVK